MAWRARSVQAPVCGDVWAGRMAPAFGRARRAGWSKTRGEDESGKRSSRVCAFRCGWTSATRECLRRGSLSFSGRRVDCGSGVRACPLFCVPLRGADQDSFIQLERVKEARDEFEYVQRIESAAWQQDTYAEPMRKLREREVAKRKRDDGGEDALPECGPAPHFIGKLWVPVGEGQASKSKKGERIAYSRFFQGIANWRE